MSILLQRYWREMMAEVSEENDAKYDAKNRFYNAHKSFGVNGTLSDDEIGRLELLHKESSFTLPQLLLCYVLCLECNASKRRLRDVAVNSLLPQCKVDDLPPFIRHQLSKIRGLNHAPKASKLPNFDRRYNKGHLKRITLATSGEQITDFSSPWFTEVYGLLSRNSTPSNSERSAFIALRSLNNPLLIQLCYLLSIDRLPSYESEYRSLVMSLTQSYYARYGTSFPPFFAPALAAIMG